MTSITELVGATPPKEARRVSLAVRDVLLKRKRTYGDEYGVIVGVSGGADSLALAVAAADITERHQIPFLALIVDHGMREGSKEEARGVAEYLVGLGISDVAVLSSGVSEGSSSIEDTARTLRHQLIQERAKSWGPTHVDILLGHTMDDQAETVLLRLARGSGNRSLAAMDQVNDLYSDGQGPSLARVRPLLSVRRADTEAFCRALGLTPVEDPSNKVDGPWRTAAGGPLPRASIRQLAIPVLSQSLEQDVVPALARNADLARRDDQALTQWAQAVAKKSLKAGQEEASILLEELSGVPEAVRSRALLIAAERAGVTSLTSSQVQALEELTKSDSNASGERRKVELPGGFEARRQSGCLVITRVR